VTTLRHFFCLIRGGHRRQTPADPKQGITVGQIWNGGLFGPNKMAIVAIEGDTIYAKRADSPKENLRRGKAASYPTHRLDFASMTRLDERWALDEEDEEK
jgi:hypothetical protein